MNTVTITPRKMQDCKLLHLQQQLKKWSSLRDSSSKLIHTQGTRDKCFMEYLNDTDKYDFKFVSVCGFQNGHDLQTTATK